MDRRLTFTLLVVVGIFFTGVVAGLNAWHENWVNRSLADQLLWADLPPSFSVHVPPDSVRGNLSLFILAGQSNMVGQASIRPEDRIPISGAWLFGNDYRWHRARAPLDNPFQQVDAVSEDVYVGVGPGLFFAKRFRSEIQSEAIGLIPCAKGGSSIAAWQPSRSDTALYGSCLKRARAASPMGTIEGILFYQGETDALSEKSPQNASVKPNQWKALFSNMAKSWREDLGLPHLPIVFAQIGSHTASTSKFPNWQRVQHQQSNVSLSRTAMIKTDDLPLRDQVHLTRKGYRNVGERMMNAWRSVNPKTP